MSNPELQTLKEQFEKNDFVLVRGFIDTKLIATTSLYMENFFNRVPNKVHDRDDFSAMSFYADPLTEVFLVDKLSCIEKITGKQLHPTYSYSRVYLGEDQLKKHNDRESCEYSVTVNVFTLGNKWPLCLEDTKGGRFNFLLNPGDAVVYKGIDVYHWRDPMNSTGTKLNAQFMLHYVDKEGPHREYKWDKREKLGLPCPT